MGVDAHCICVLFTSSSSFTSSGTSCRSLRSRRSQQHSVSCSESLLDAPHKPAGGALHNSSSHSVMSDASLLSSLLSSLLDESSIQERTQVDALWGTNPPVYLIIDLMILIHKALFLQSASQGQQHLVINERNENLICFFRLRSAQINIFGSLSKISMPA